MLRSLAALLETPIQAIDAEIGRLRDVLFHDRSWTIRYFVIDTGTWLSGRQVLLSPFVVRVPEAGSSELNVTLTREQVQNSPETDSDLPVSRQKEIAMSLHYGWPAYWTLEPSATAEVPEGDPNLRSAKELLSYSVKTTDGELGQVADFVVEDANWFIRFLGVGTGYLFGGQRLLVGTRWVGSISWANREILLPHSTHML